MLKKKKQKRATLKKKILQIKENIKKHKAPKQGVTLLAVSKGQSIEKVNLAVSMGLRFFGENKVQEAEKKFSMEESILSCVSPVTVFDSLTSPQPISPLTLSMRTRTTLRLRYF